MKTITPSPPYRPFQRRFWTAYVIHMRPYLLFISGMAGLAGMALSVDSFSFTMSMVLVFGAFFLSYGFGQAFTDTFQTDTDSLSAAYRPLSQKLLLPKDVRLMSLIGLALCVFLLAWFNSYNLFFGLLCMLGLAGYSYFKKNYWYIGPYLNAFVVGVLPLMGSHCFKNGLHLPSELLVVGIINFLAYANFVIIGYLKDISADRATGYRTIPVVWGWDAALWFGNIHIMLIFSCFFYFWDQVLWPWQAIVLFVMASGIAVYGQMAGHLASPKIETNSKVPVVSTVRSFLLWNGTLVLMFHPGLWVPFLVFYLIFEIILFKRPLAHQI
jgi:4-hydroxybenzoate polyprenyltransferase